MIAQGTVGEVAANPSSRIAPFLADNVSARIRERVAERRCSTWPHPHDNQPAAYGQAAGRDIPRGRLVAVTGVSGSGKTTMVLESLIPALKAQAAGERLPEHVRELEAEGIHRANLIDATPIGANVRSTVATYADIHDELRRASPARTAPRRAAGRLAISHTTPADCVAPHATAPVQSCSMCSSCRT